MLITKKMNFVHIPPHLSSFWKFCYEMDLSEEAVPDRENKDGELNSKFTKEIIK
jgi:hypothetical protein